MKKYWKVKVLENLMKHNIEGSTITMDCYYYDKKLIKLMAGAYRDGWEDCLKNEK